MDNKVESTAGASLLIKKVFVALCDLAYVHGYYRCPLNKEVEEILDCSDINPEGSAKCRVSLRSTGKRNKSKDNKIRENK